MIDLSSTKIRTIIAIVIACLFAFLVYYFATHGRIVVKNLGDDTLTVVLLKKDGSSTDPKNIGNGSVVASGDYVVRNSHNGLSRLVHVTVSGWLKASEVTFEDIRSAKTSRVAALTYEHLVPGGNGTYVSYTDLDGYASGFTTHQPTDAYGGKSVDTPLPRDITAPSSTSDGQLIGIIDDTLSKYNFNTGVAERIVSFGHSEEEHTGEIIDAPALKRSSDVNSSLIGLYQRADEKLTVIDGSKIVKETKLTSTNDQSVMFDINDKARAILQKTTEPPTNSSLESEDETLGFSITVHGTSAAPRTVDIGRASVVEKLAIDPSGEYIAVNKDNHLWVYRVSDGEVVMFNPFTVSTALYWNKTNLYSLSTDTGISVFNTKTRQLLPVSVDTGKSLSFSSVVPFGSKLYFTAYNTKQNSQLPDGYVIDLNQKDDGVTRVLAEKLPYKSEDYEISFLENTLYVRINYFESDENSSTYAAKIASIKSKAQEKIKDLISDEILKKCTVVYDR